MDDDARLPDVHDPFADGDGVAGHGWTVHPARRQPWALAFLAAGLLTAGAAAHEVTGSRWAAALCPLVLAVLFRGFLFPTTYTVDAAGAGARTPFGTHQMAWAEVGRLHHDSAGALLSRSAEPGFWGRRLALKFAWADNRRAAVRYMLDRLPPGARVTAEKE